MSFLTTRIFVLIAAFVLLFLTTVASASSDPAFAGIAAKANDSMSANHNPAGLARISESEWTGRIIGGRCDRDAVVQKASVREHPLHLLFAVLGPFVAVEIGVGIEGKRDGAGLLDAPQETLADERTMLESMPGILPWWSFSTRS